MELSEARTYEEMARDRLREELLRPDLQEKDFQLEEVGLLGSWPRTRLIVFFRREDMPDTRFGFWVPVWEVVAWHELNMPAGAEPDIRTHPAFLASSVMEMLDGAIGNALVDSPWLGRRSPYRRPKVDVIPTKWMTPILDW